MTREAAAVLIVRFQLLRIEKAALGKRRIQRRSRVTLAENEAVSAVPAGVFRVIAKNIRIQHAHDIRHRKNGADVAAV